jgi:hypothetical protein
VITLVTQKEVHNFLVNNTTMCQKINISATYGNDVEKIKSFEKDVANFINGFTETYKTSLGPVVDYLTHEIKD